MTGGPAAVFDIDGVLADASARQHFIEGRGAKNWPAFFDACGEDTVVAEMARLSTLLDKDLALVLLTGRPMTVEPTTLRWLERHQLRWDLLIMRDHGDYSAALDFKRRTVHELRTHGFDLRIAFEDDRRNRDMFEAEDVPCVYIHSGYYD